ncbi:MAG: HEPN domain-containing protein [Acidobacteria bacterium]|nr:HEPN domain-containing protein [Acidobacteriota bacterium]
MSLAEAFQAYIDLVGSAITSTARITAKTTMTELSAQDILDLRKLVVDLESRMEFQNLIRETVAEFSTESTESAFIRELWRFNVESYFRRSGFYLSAYRRETQETDALLSSYKEAFETKRVIRKYLVPLEFVYFDDDLMDFGEFRIVQPSYDDLKSLLLNEINQVFYPYAYADLSNLSDLWFLETNEEVDAWEPGSGGITTIPGPEVSVTLSDFPSPVIHALKHLVLYDWGTSSASLLPDRKSKLITDLEVGWECFQVPFIISHEENPIWPPKAMPDLSVLATVPIINDEGEEVGERPATTIFIESEKFNASMQRVVEQITSLRERCAGITCEWFFFDRALDYLVKAFFANDLDQLLWHMVAVESLLGDDDGAGLTKRLSLRVPFVITEDKGERSRIKKLITSNDDGLYQLRSDLVHGNDKLINKGVYLGHLREARELARKASLWFLKSLSNLNQQLAERGIGSSPPSREEIIKAIDVLSAEKLDADKVRVVLDVFSPSKAPGSE